MKSIFWAKSGHFNFDKKRSDCIFWCQSQHKCSAHTTYLLNILKSNSKKQGLTRKRMTRYNTSAVCTCMRCIFAIILELNRVCAFAMYKKLEFILFKGYSADTFNLSLYFQFMVESIELKKKNNWYKITSPKYWFDSSCNEMDVHTF